MTAALIPTITLSTPIDIFPDLNGPKYSQEEARIILEVAEGLDGRFAPYATRSEKAAAEKKIHDAKVAEEKRIAAEKAEAARIAAQKAAEEAERQRLAQEAAAAEAARLAAIAPVQQRSVIPGNTYAAGNCTWYAKDRRPDLPNNLGNANTWATEAAAQGIPTGTRPRPGAIGVSLEGYYGHVVYVEAIQPNEGTMTISEMNYGGLYQMNTRTIPAAGWSFVY